MTRPWLDPRLAEQLRRAGHRRVTAILVLAADAELELPMEVDVLHDWPRFRTRVIHAPAEVLRALWRTREVEALSAVDIDHLGL